MARVVVEPAGGGGADGECTLSCRHGQGTGPAVTPPGGPGPRAQVPALLGTPAHCQAGWWRDQHEDAKWVGPCATLPEGVV